MSTTPAQQSDSNETATLAASTPADDAPGTTQESTQGNPELGSNATPPTQQEDAPKKALCGVCNVNAPKYKCPRCYLPYCSVACNKQHRENHPPDPEPKAEPKTTPSIRNDAASKAVDPSNPFRALESSDKLRLLFEKYPGLPDQLLQIHAATLPPTEPASQNAGIPASLLKGLPKKETWNHDIGIQNGKEALRKARRAEGEEGDAIREYTELILHLTNAQDAESDVANLLRQQLAQEDTKLIERLMAEEKR